MNNTLDYKCPNCNTELKFNSKNQCWECEYCKSEFRLQNSNQKNEINNFESTPVVGSIDLYTCPNCGATIITDLNTIITSCVYCKNTKILKNKLEEEFKPNYIIPFKLTKKDATSIFKRFIKGKLLIPQKFKSKKNIDGIFGIYIPLLLCDYEVSGIIETNCNSINNWRSGHYMYTKTDTYLALRSGSMNFENVPVDCSKKIPSEIINFIEPFDYGELKKFDFSYLSGFLTEKYDVINDEAIQNSTANVKQAFINEMKKDIIGYNNITLTNDSININNTKSFYALVPIWLLNVKYKDEICVFVINGQTGKLTGNIPIDRKKVVILWIVIFIITFLISFGLFYMKGSL